MKFSIKLKFFQVMFYITYIICMFGALYSLKSCIICAILDFLLSKDQGGKAESLEDSNFFFFIGVRPSVRPSVGRSV